MDLCLLGDSEVPEEGNFWRKHWFLWHLGQGNSLLYTIAICAVLSASSISLDTVSLKMLPHCSKDSLVLSGGGSTTSHGESCPLGRAI